MKLFQEKDIEVLHTEKHPLGSRTPDSEIISFCDADDWILITKDSDFLDSYLIRKKPRKLLLVTTGNIRNQNLFFLFEQFLPAMLKEFSTNEWLELTNEGWIVHESGF